MPTSTVESGGENDVAFSSSSANTRTRSGPSEAASVISRDVAELDPLVVLDLGQRRTQRGRQRDGSGDPRRLRVAPATTSRLSAVRRRRVDRWSSR